MQDHFRKNVPDENEFYPIVHTAKVNPFFSSNGGSSTSRCMFFLQENFGNSSIISFYFLLSSILCFLITRLISFDAEMIPKIRSYSFYILFSLAVMLYRREVSGFDSVLLKIRGIFWLSRFVRGFVIENSLLSDILWGKKSFGSFWCEIIIERFILGEMSSIG